MYLDFLHTKLKTNCYGCRACEEICPKKCISMFEDKETFLYPRIDKTQCINCNLCHKVCPVNDTSDDLSDNNEFFQVAVAAVHKQEDVVFNSSSGGAFTAILNSVYDENTVIFGVCYDDNLRVVHDYSTTIDDAYKFRKSKYVQSNTNGSYSKVKKFLSDNKKVVFSGTPCQVAGLKNYLKGTDTKNLICIDLVCHGVPSQKLFDMHIKELSESSIVKKFEFRYKYNKNNSYNSRTAKISYANDIEDIVEISDDEYLKAYYSRLIYRPCCLKCKFASPKRVSDVTIADAWNIEKKYPQLDALKGCSLIIANSINGKKILKDLNNYMNIYPLDMQWAIKSNEQLHKPTSFHIKRKVFFNKIKRHSFDYSVNKAIEITIMDRVFLKLKRIAKTIIGGIRFNG